MGRDGGLCSGQSLKSLVWFSLDEVLSIIRITNVDGPSSNPAINIFKRKNYCQHIFVWN